MPILYGSPISPFVRKVAVVLEEKGISYEWKQVRPHDKSEEFRSISPLGKIPAYRDDRIALADSSVISFYLEKTHPEIPLYPADTVDLAHALWFEEYFDGGLSVPLTTVFFQRWMNPVVLHKPTDEALVKDALEKKLPPMLGYLESQVRPGAWIVGEYFSIADISLALGFVNMQLIQYQLDSTLYPKLVAYLARIHARPSFQKATAAMHEFIRELKEKMAAAPPA